MYSTIISFGWLAHIILSFYLIRPLKTFSHRALLTIIPCLILIFVGCYGQPILHMSTVMIISLYWMLAIRLVHLIVLSPNETDSLGSYVLKFLWLAMPIVPNQGQEPTINYLGAVGIKLLLVHWTYQWMRSCEPNDSYGRVGLFYIYICAGTFINDIQILLVRLVTRNKYSLLEFNKYPFLSKSVREFWGRRYNLLVGTLLKESVFDPIRRLTHCSAMIGALSSFIISGLLHAHVAVGGFGESNPLPAFFYFILQAIACSLETKFPFTPPRLLGIVLTHAFLLVTAPLYVGLFTRAPLEYHEINKPVLFDATWFPKLPVPNYCPK